MVTDPYVPATAVATLPTGGVAGVPAATPTTVSVSPSGSLSCPTVPGVTSPSTLAASSLTVFTSATAVGRSLTGSTVTVTVAVSKPPFPSVIV